MDHPKDHSLFGLGLPGHPFLFIPRFFYDSMTMPREFQAFLTRKHQPEHLDLGSLQSQSSSLGDRPQPTEP